MKLIALALLATSAFAAETIEAFGMKWDVPFASEWKFEDGVLRMLKPRPQEKNPRRPVQFALAQTGNYSDIEINVDVKRNAKSMIIVYAYEKEGHFNYAHLSADTARAQPHHNGVFHVYGGERVRISAETGPAALVTPDWHKVRLVHDARTGKVPVTVDGKRVPSIEATDASLGAGRVGLGSFDETAQFRNVKINVR